MAKEPKKTETGRKLDAATKVTASFTGKTPKLADVTKTETKREDKPLTSAQLRDMRSRLGDTGPTM